MNKATLIHVYKQVFYVDDAAHKELNDYLSALQKIFADTEDGQEIVDDIELRMAEKLREEVPDDKQIVELVDVQKIIGQIGRIEDFEEESGSTKSNKTNHGTKTKSSTAKRELYRDVDNAKLGGVASGLAKYFDLDVVFVRALFIIASLLGFSGGIVYIILWTIMEPADSAYKKVVMEGKSPSKDNLENAVKSAKDMASKQAKGLGGFLRKALGFANRIFMKSYKVIIAIAGTFFSAGLLIAAIAVATVAGFFVFEQGPIPQEVIEGAKTTAFDKIGIAAAAAAVLTILLPMLILGFGLIRRKLFKIPAALIVGLVSIFAVSVTVAAISLSSYGPRFVDSADDYVHTETTIQLDEFSSIKLGSSDFDGFHTTVVVDETRGYEAVITGPPEHSNEFFDWSINEGELDIKVELLDDFNSGFIESITLYTPDSPSELDISEYSSHVEIFNLQADTFTLVDNSNKQENNYGGSVYLSGTVKNLVANIGEVDLHAESLKVQDADITLESGAQASVNVDGEATVKRTSFSRFVNYGQGTLSETILPSDNRPSSWDVKHSRDEECYEDSFFGGTVCDSYPAIH